MAPSLPPDPPAARCAFWRKEATLRRRGEGGESCFWRCGNSVLPWELRCPLKNSGPSWKRMFLNPRSFWRSNFCPTEDPIVSSYSALVKHNLGPKLSLDKRPNGKCPWWKSGLKVLGNTKTGVEKLHDAGFWVYAILAIGLLLFCLLDLLWTKMAWSNKQVRKTPPEDGCALN